MASTTCSFCKRYTHMTIQWATMYHLEYPSPDGLVHGRIVEGIATCDSCGRTSMGSSFDPAEVSSDARFNLAETREDSVRWLPRVGESPIFEDVPSHIAQAAQEAHSAASISAFMAAILMARTVVEATAKEKDVTKGNLLSKIDRMAELNIIRQDTKDAAHEIRLQGNEMAHGDITTQPTEEDAGEILDLMDEILNEVFQGPARTARIKARRMGTL